MKEIVFIKQKMEFIPSGEIARNPGFLLIIIGWGELGKAILLVSIAVFFHLL